MGLPEPLEDRFEKTYTELERSVTMAEGMSPLMRRAHDRGEQRGAVVELRTVLLHLGHGALGLLGDVRWRFRFPVEVGGSFPLAVR